MRTSEAGALRATYANHASPWPLVRRAGDTVGKRPSTRMAFLVDTIVGPDGKAVALRGYVARNDMTGWTASLRRIDWADVVRSWSKQPDVSTIRAIKRRMAPVREA